ncbi:hypothetical protein O3G_MSEX014459 [Manduca sexta]|uniref:Fibronectin type-III domain-containing protein n=1 Tax=Manduca sexta TaxID=7130 RepID=A0A921ZUY3_MANSE|nr:hypothetical protein O3G_MSEX014459 [Manduca sexta]
MSSSSTTTVEITSTSTTTLPTTPKLIDTSENKTDIDTTTEAQNVNEAKPKPRLLNLSVDELQNFANALHNQTEDRSNKKGIDLSDVTLDDDEDEPPRVLPEHKHKDIPDKFYTNLQAPFHHLLNPDRGSDEVETCKENEISYKVGERMDRGCEESCECTPGGVFECSPRCKHPYIRRGRRLNDPLCFESPVDDCCSIMACATGNGDIKPTKVEVCRYGNETYAVGTKWNIGCEQSCTCEPNSIVTCKPRCNPLPPSEKCINVQDPNDACCEIQVCDVSHDVHEEPSENITSSTTKETNGNFEDLDELRATMRPLVLAEPIGSVKVLHNNSVQVNLMHLNNSEDPIHLLLSSDGGKSYEDVELKYSNLILDLEGGKDYILKTKETGTKFNFTITASNAGVNEVQDEELVNTTKAGCFENGQFYAVGEEFHIGCEQLCECTGPDTRECAEMICPSHVGLELMSKGCVKWAPNPPAQPPNCCPRSARCLSDGTCHYNGIAVPNWSEVPLSLTGCERRCYCENGVLDCQEVCAPLPPIPPQTLRCPPLHHPTPVNISDEDCCKRWACVPNANDKGSSLKTYSMPTLGEPNVNFVTPVVPLLPTITSSILPTPLTTDSIDFYKHLTPVKSFSKLKPVNPVSISKAKNAITQDNASDNNITVFTLDDFESPFKTIHAEPPLVNHDYQFPFQDHRQGAVIDNPKKPPNFITHLHHGNDMNFILTDKKQNPLQNAIESRYPTFKQQYLSHSLGPLKIPFQIHDPVKKIPLSQIDNLDLFLPDHDHKVITPTVSYPKAYVNPTIKTITDLRTNQKFFEPAIMNKSANYPVPKVSINSILYNDPKENAASGTHKQVTVLRTNDVQNVKTTNNQHNDIIWRQNDKHLLTKAPNPYETVLLRAVPNAHIDTVPASTTNTKIRYAGKPYSSLDLEHLLSQMEIESEVNRNLGRSADKNQEAAAGQGSAAGFPMHPAHPPHPGPSFLPTVPPEKRYPQEGVADYDDIHRPVNSLEPNLPGLPPEFTVPPHFVDDNKKLTVISIQADSPTSIKMLFGLPPLLVGLRGSIDLRYTDKPDEDVSKWNSQVFAPADEVLTTPRLEFRLTDLKPSTTYKIRGKLYLHNLPVEPESGVYIVHTPDLPTAGPVEEKRREIDSKLTVVDVNVTTAHVSWRHFDEDELQFIDAIQVRYRPVGTPIYSMTELLHHSRSTAELHDLRPGSTYEAALVLVPPPKATTELHDPGKVEFTTAPFIDPYNWTVVVEARAVGSEAVEVMWRGVPAPAERWVRVYRAAHACGGHAAPAERREHDDFRLAARDLPATITLTGLEPNSSRGSPRGDYYGALVVVGVVAALGALTSLLLLLVVVRRHRPRSVPITPVPTAPRESSLPPYDNPAYKLELQQETMVAGSRGSPRGDYYGALVVVGVVAALGALTSLLLLLVVVRRHRPRSVPITPVPTAPRESSLPPYDNPAYKLELQQETMDL